MKCYYCENFSLGWCKYYNEMLEPAVIEDDHKCDGENDVIMGWNDSTL